MRSVCSTQGTQPRRHYVRDAEHGALCGFAPTMGARWKPAPRKARTCVNCHRLFNQLPALTAYSLTR